MRFLGTCIRFWWPIALGVIIDWAISLFSLIIMINVLGLMFGSIDRGIFNLLFLPSGLIATAIGALPAAALSRNRELLAGFLTGLGSIALTFVVTDAHLNALDLIMLLLMLPTAGLCGFAVAKARSTYATNQQPDKLN